MSIAGSCTGETAVKGREGQQKKADWRDEDHGNTCHWQVSATKSEMLTVHFCNTSRTQGAEVTVDEMTVVTVGA